MNSHGFGADLERAYDLVASRVRSAANLHDHL
jgi:hypothetical protein